MSEPIVLHAPAWLMPALRAAAEQSEPAPTWVVAFAGVGLRCRRCRTVAWDPPFPVPVEDSTALMRAFIEAHRKCPEPEDASRE